MIKNKILLHTLLLFYSFCGVLSKLAAGKEFLSIEWCLLYGGSMIILAIYAVLWQKILKRMELTEAFFSKAVTIIWGMLWGALFFSETITWNMVLGAGIVLVGVYVIGGKYE